MKINLPLFLGRSDEDGSYFFLGLDKKVARFIKYSNTRDAIFWCYSTSLPDFLDLGEVPEFVLNKVINFVGGPVEVTTTVTSGRRRKKDQQNPPSIKEVNGELHVTIDSTETSSSGQEKSVNSLSGQRNQRGNDSKRLPFEKNEGSQDSTTETAQESGSAVEETTKCRQSSNSSIGHHNLRGLSSSSGSGTRCSDEESKSELRRMFEHGVLGDGGDGEQQLPESTSSSGTDGSELNGPDGSGIKPKRKRRTKAEMQLAREFESLRRGDL